MAISAVRSQPGLTNQDQQFAGFSSKPAGSGTAQPIRFNLMITRMLMDNDILQEAKPVQRWILQVMRIKCKQQEKQQRQISEEELSQHVY